MYIKGVVMCGTGKIREINQDNYYLDGLYRDVMEDTEVQREESSTCGTALYAVADGMGGEKYGEIASLITVSSLGDLDRSASCKELRQYLLDRNGDVCDFITRNDGARSGSTFVGLLIHDNYAEIVNIGDSRAYLLREGRLTQISQDHTSIQQMVRLGVLTPGEARRHPKRHELSQHLGIFPNEYIIEPFMFSLELSPGDMFLLCSDGLYDMVEDWKIRELLLASGHLQDKVIKLYDAALQAGGKDNITVLLVQVETKEDYSL